MPTEEQIDNLILESSLRYGAVLSLSKHGLRPIEISKLGLANFDLERGIISVPTAKYGAGRNIKLNSKSLAIIKTYLNRYKYKRLFPNVNAIRQDYARIRKRVAEKLQDRSYLNIRLYDFRHWFATMTYIKTRDIMYIKYLLGHKTLQHTLKYIHLAQITEETSDDWICKVAPTLQETCQLIEQGFDYVTDFEGKKLFRKRK